MTPETTLTVSQIQAQERTQELEPVQAQRIERATAGLADILVELLK